MEDSLKKKILDEEVINGTLNDMFDMRKRKTHLLSEIELIGSSIDDLKYCKQGLERELSAKGLKIPVCIDGSAHGNYSVNVGYYLGKFKSLKSF